MAAMTVQEYCDKVAEINDLALKAEQSGLHDEAQKLLKQLAELMKQDAKDSIAKIKQRGAADIAEFEQEFKKITAAIDAARQDLAKTGNAIDALAKFLGWLERILKTAVGVAAV